MFLILGRSEGADKSAAMGVESGSKALILLDQGSSTYEYSKIDLNPHLITTPRLTRCNNKRNRPTPPSGFALSRCSMKRNRPPLSRCSQKRNHPPPPSGVALSRCSMKKKKRRKLFTLGRFGRYLRVRGRPPPPPPPPFPEPLSVRRRGKFTCALAAGVAVLGSKIYIVGGYFSSRIFCSHRGVYTIDASSDSPEMIELSESELNFAKPRPIVCTIRGKIYALPGNLINELEFECFDPQSNSWTVLPSPREAIYGDFKLSASEKVKIENLRVPRRNRLRVFSHAVVGSNLLISLDAGGSAYTFDTAQPDSRWRRILLNLVTENATHLLNYLPFDSSAFPIRDDLIFCPPRQSDWGLDAHFRKGFGINICNEDSYVCSFHDVAELSNPNCRYVNISIHTVTGMGPMPLGRWYDDGEFELWDFAKNSRAIRDGMVLAFKNGSSEYAFHIYQVTRAGEDHHYRASKISSATFERGQVLVNVIPLVIKG